MTAYHEIVAAMPLGGLDTNPTLLRALIAGRLPYFFGSGDDPTQFVAVDPSTGDVTPLIIKDGGLFFYDAADSTTLNDGVTCWVSSDGKRYKLTGAAGWITAVLGKDTTAQPSSPSLGDAYLVPAAATGAAWSGKDDSIAVYTARGWDFASPNTGRLLYVADEESYYHYEAAGVWVLGIGLGALGTNDVAPANMLGGRSHFVVENQTTNTPPSPAAGVAYIVGPSPTGAWSGKSGQIAIRDKLATGWVFVAPTQGITAFDKASGAPYSYTGAAWASTAGSYVSRYADNKNSVTGLTVTNNGSATNTTTGYTWSATTGPTSTTVGRIVDIYLPTIAAKKAGAEFELQWWGALRLTAARSGVSVTSTITATTMAIFVDTETTPRDWRFLPEVPLVSGAGSSVVGSWFEIAAKLFRFVLADTSNHDIRLRIYCTVSNASGSATTTISAADVINRTMIIREAA